MSTIPCSVCSTVTLPYAAWLAQPKPRPIRRGIEGMCVTCRNRSGQADPGPTVRADDALTDWRWLHETGELSDTDSLSARVRVAAPRMGMSVGALAKCLERAGIRNPTEPTGMPDKARSEMAFCDQCHHLRLQLDVAESDVRHLARKLAARDDSVRLRQRLGEAQDHLAEQVAARDFHLDADHPETEMVAA